MAEKLTLEQQINRDYRRGRKSLAREFAELWLMGDEGEAIKLISQELGERLSYEPNKD